MAVLGEIQRDLNIKVPQGFIITTNLINEFMKHNNLQNSINNKYKELKNDLNSSKYLHEFSNHAQKMINEASIPNHLQKAILNEYTKLVQDFSPNTRVALRSSATGEDSIQTSFAGMFKSKLNVGKETLFSAFKEVVAAKYSYTALKYRKHYGLNVEEQQMAVGCLVMSSAVSGGVLYTQDPTNSENKTLLISSNWGLPVSVVDGSTHTDTFYVSRERPLEIVKQDIGYKKSHFVCHIEEGTCRLEANEKMQSLPSLQKYQICNLAQIGLELEKYFQTPLDIEWVLEPSGDFTILQCRPLSQTSLQATAWEAPSDTPPPFLTAGVCASPGQGAGPVHIINREADAKTFPEGGILVTRYALPKWATLLESASAVITEEGNIAGHLANVAREFQIPAIFSLNEATSLLQEGQHVTVDATRHEIYNGSFTITPHKLTANHTNTSPSTALHPYLKNIYEHIFPLHLLDPEGADFRARNCTTWHDITRFCHEKGVKEIFNFGQRQALSDQASKQLVAGDIKNVPMQFWVINLDNGYANPVSGPYVHIENICSKPMLPLWQGMTNIPWAGPPPIDTKGFLSILLEASSNPNLDPSVQSDYQNKNYFMISETFCSLHSRFGFHFSIVEAMLGDQHRENYISFQFKGGAANHARRVARAQLILEILENYNFSVRLRDDALFARTDNLPDTETAQRLLVVGYLVMHTRQLDMVMKNSHSSAEQRKRIYSDLSTLLENWEKRKEGAA